MHAATEPSILRLKSLDDVGEIHHSVIVLPIEASKIGQAQALLKRIDIENPAAAKILVGADLTLAQIRELNNASTNLYFAAEFESDDFDAALSSAQDYVRSRQKQKDNAKTRERTQRRKQNLNKRVDSLHRALMAVHKSSSVSEIENSLFEALKISHDLSWVRIFLHSGDHIDSQLDRVRGQFLFKHPLFLGAVHLGKIVFARTSAQAFAKAEEEALAQIGGSVALALDRIAKIDQAGNLKQQWESTFDAISEPLCVTDDNFMIIRTNRAFLQTTGLKNAAALGANCFKAFCDQTMPITNSLVVKRKVRRGKETQLRSYEVNTQRIRATDPNADDGFDSLAQQDRSILLVLFRDVTEQKDIENRILESAKMAELGTVGSSIAHDINNPLGGMMSFLQLIKMDLKLSDPIRPDIEQMEAACHRCKEIVENLLLFSRRQEPGAAETLDLRAAVKQALKILELQTRSLGIEIEIKEPESEVKMLGHFNLLSQALSYIFQASFESVAERLKGSPGFKGLINVEIQTNDKMTVILVRDNGGLISHEHQNKISGISQSLAQQIITDHGGHIDFFAQPNVGTSAKIAFINV